MVVMAWMILEKKGSWGRGIFNNFKTIDDIVDFITNVLKIMLDISQCSRRPAHEWWPPPSPRCGRTSLTQNKTVLTRAECGAAAAAGGQPRPPTNSHSHFARFCGARSRESGRRLDRAEDGPAACLLELFNVDINVH